MDTYYIIDNGNKFDTSHLEYAKVSDTIHLILRNVPKKGLLGQMLINPFLKNNIKYSVLKGFSENITDFTLVPLVFETIMKNKDKKIVIISKNSKLSCLTSYYKNKFNYNLEIAGTLKEYYLINYISKELGIEYDKALEIFNDLKKFKASEGRKISARLKVSLEKNEEFFGKILELDDVWEDEKSKKQVSAPKDLVKVQTSKNEVGEGLDKSSNNQVVMENLV